MSSSEGRTRGTGRRSAVMLSLLLAAVALPACTVRPLYSSAPLTYGGQSAAEELSQISIKPVQTRTAQEVRNHLIFIFGRGKGEPASARYSMQLIVTSIIESAAQVQVADENEPSASLVSMKGSYKLLDTASGEVVGEGVREVSSSYDIPRQEFAAVRALRDAENRAARELAEAIHLDIVQELSRRDGS